MFPWGPDGGRPPTHDPAAILQQIAKAAEDAYVMSMTWAADQVRSVAILAAVIGAGVGALVGAVVAAVVLVVAG